MSYNFLVYIKKVGSHLYIISISICILIRYDLYEIEFEKQIVLSVLHLAII